MKKRFRMLAGPNGSGKSTLRRQLAEKYSVNFYTFLNADDIFTEVRRSGAYLFPLAVDVVDFETYVKASTYGEEVKSLMLNETVLTDEQIRFRSPSAINSYTIALLTNFLQHAFIKDGRSFSQETVFSHASKIEALREAQKAGFRTYLYFVCTDSADLNAARVESRVASGGHSVPADKIAARYERSLANVRAALSCCSRVYFFDNSNTMHLVAEYETGRGFVSQSSVLPGWFARLHLA